MTPEVSHGAADERGRLIDECRILGARAQANLLQADADTIRTLRTEVERLTALNEALQQRVDAFGDLDIAVRELLAWVQTTAGDNIDRDAARIELNTVDAVKRAIAASGARSEG